MAESIFRSGLRRLRAAVDLGARFVGFRHSEATMQRDADRFWADRSHKSFGVNSHWRGHGMFKNDDPRWFSIGNHHLELFKSLSQTLTSRLPDAPSVLEWGCGGGANAVAFAPIANRFVGVDISQHSIEECMRQTSLKGVSNATGLVVDIRQPEAVLSKVAPVDIVLCTYVFELLPSKTYALKLLEIFHDLLNPGGVAFVQIRYATAKFSTQGRTWGYRLAFASIVSFFLDEFWQASEDLGFAPKCLTLVPQDSTVCDERYAYFLLEKPRNPS